MKSFNIRGSIGGQFHFEHVSPSSDVGVHYFIFENGKITYAGPFSTPVDSDIPPSDIPPNETYSYHVDLTGKRMWQTTPVVSEEEEETPTGGGGGPPGGTRGWSVRGRKPEDRQMGVRRDAQDIMDLTILLVQSGVLDE
jgi:hypothetical protein